jgi:hypothetical protein
MRHYSHNQQRYPEQSQVKVAVLAESMSQASASEQYWQNLVLSGVLLTLALAVFALIH